MISRLRFEEDGHRYFLDGHRIASNTQILKAEGLINDAFYTPEGRDRGSRVHLGSWFADAGNLDWNSIIEEERGYIHGFLKFKKEFEWQTDFNELPVWGSPGYGTRLDLLGSGIFQINNDFRRRRAVVDMKSGIAGKEVGWQTGGQKRAVIERIQAQDEEWTQHLECINGHQYPELRFALELKKNGTYKLRPFSDPIEEEQFPALVHFYNWKVRNGLIKEI